MRKEDSQRIIGLIQSLLTEYPPFEGDHANLEYFLVLAQWYYLSQIIVQEEQTIVMASRMIKYFLFVGLMRDKGGRKIVRDNCYTCGQATTPTEVQYVCSGCRVACYCSIDHQRATWKKEAVKGTRIGHEILCPLYKAFRKDQLQKVSQDRDEEKESKVQRRLHENMWFLEYGLGLHFIMLVKNMFVSYRSITTMAFVFIMKCLNQSSSILSWMMKCKK
ncbi:predicted protein [Chaetoceros tenuissimus]|uniref:MYND-type domain-containing protein n=1 Tax=Chaetoceros tenuissimus TaxID=426638 RepID=A0AAD3D990_9STRA|nr:predicted protein [Chaetoceros tenuissimus]